MTALLLVVRLVLAAVFAVAGVGKLADLKGSRRAITDFGLPAALAAPLGLLLPLAELAVAVALIPTFTAFWGAIGALVLLLLFVAGIGANLARGKKPDCHCFGQLHSAPAGWKTLARNGVLAALAGFLIWQGLERGNVGLSAVAWIWALSAPQALWIVAGLLVLVVLGSQAWFLLHLLRQNGRFLVRLEALESRISGGAAPSQNGGTAAQPAAGLPVGTQAPSFSLKGLYGETLTLDSLRAPGKPVMLLFTDPDCGPCTALLPDIRNWQKDHSRKLTFALISRGSVAQNRAKSTEHGLGGVLLQEDWEVFNSYEAYGTPSAVLVQPDGTIGSPVAAGAEAIQNLVDQAVEGRAAAQLPLWPQQAQEGTPCPNCGKVHSNGHAHQAAPEPQGLKVGEPAPPVKLEDLSGRSVRLEDFRGQETLVLFWNPGCGFCQQMLPDLKEWEENAPKGAPKLLVVSAGTEEANKEMGLGSPVVLDQTFSVLRSFGATGTPSAVLVGADGKIASELAVGAPAVLELTKAK